MASFFFILSILFLIFLASRMTITVSLPGSHHNISLLNNHSFTLLLQLPPPLSSKSKYKIISYKQSIFTKSLSPRCIAGSSIQFITEFKYLGMLFSSLSWSNHIPCISSKTRKLLGHLYSYFYYHSNTFTLLRLFTSLIRPRLEYCSFLWDTQSSNLSTCLEKINSLPVN